MTKNHSVREAGRQAGEAISGDSVAHYLLFYDVVSDYQDRRRPHRAAHLLYAAEAVERGELILGGALADPVDGAVLLFRSAAAARAFAATDPYVLQGLVTQWRVREWTTVVGRGLPGVPA